MSRLTLRPYQREAIEQILSHRRSGLRRMLVCLPTGSGKTVIFSELARLSRKQVLVLAHRAELVEQARDKIQRCLGKGATADIEQASQHASPEAKVVVASIRSLGEQRLSRLIAERDIRLVIYDECHHAAAEDNRRVLTQLGAFEPDWPGTLVGFTATTTRGDGQGLNDIFDKIVYTRSLQRMIEDGYLVPLRGYRISTTVDLAGIPTGREDYAIEALAEAVDIEARNALVARSIQELARDRRIIVFCVTVQHAVHMARALIHLGIPSGVVHGRMDRDDRVETLARFRAGRLQALTNVGVLTEGFDDPGVSCIALARPTRSVGLYAQCVGRGTRLAPGKRDCLILDFVDVSQLGLVSLPGLFGMPHQLDLEGREVTEAQRFFHQVRFDLPSFEMEAEGITLGEIQQRAAAFNPLNLRLDSEIGAISANAWCSLGSAGLALHFQRRPRRLSSFLVIARGKRRGDRYHVLLDDRKMAHFSNIEAAVEAVDYELSRMGRHARGSALPSAQWRRAPVPAALQGQLRQLRPPRKASCQGDAIRLLCFASHGRRR